MNTTTKDLLSNYISQKINNKPWLQDLLYKVYSGHDIDSSMLSKCLDSCIEKKQESEYPISEIKTSTSIGNINFSIEKIHGIDNVALLGDNSELIPKETGLTLIYGANGTGKSSYSQIIKSLFKARGWESVNPNPNAYLEDTAQTAYVDLKINNNSKSFNVFDFTDDETPQKGFVFDSETQTKYLVGKGFSKLSFPLPGEEILIKYSELLDSISELATEKLGAMNYPVLSTDLSENSEVKRLGLASSIKELNRILNEIEIKSDLWNSRKEKELLSLKSRKEALTHKDKAKKECIAKGDGLSQLESLTNQLVLESTNLSVLSQDNIAKNKELAVLSNFRESSCDPDLEELWKKMVQSSFDYHKKSNNNDTVYITDSCPLCERSFDEDSFSKIKNMFELMLSTAQQNITNNNSKINMIRSQFKGRPLEFFKNPFEDDNDVSLFVLEHIKKLEDALGEISTNLNTSLEGVLYFPKELSEEIARQKSALQVINSTDTEELIDAQISEIEQIKLLHDHSVVINACFEKQKEKIELETLGLASIKTGVTNYLSANRDGQLIQKFNDNLEENFDFFRNKLSGFKVEKKKASKGSLTVALIPERPIKAQGLDLNSILSQGEQRVIALCVFYAEVCLSDDLTPVVFDDPASSLDNDYKRLIALFLEKISRDGRQVIVFSHDNGLTKNIVNSPDSSNYKKLYLKKQVFAGQEVSGIVQMNKDGKNAIISSAKERYKLLNRNLEDIERHDLMSLSQNLMGVFEEVLLYQLHLATHDMKKVEQACDQIFVLQNSIKGVFRSGQTSRHISQIDDSSDDDLRFNMSETFIHMDTIFQEI